MARHFPWFTSRSSSPVLVAHVASPQDLHRALNDGWYRLRPCQAVDDLGDLRRFRYLALYESGWDARPPYRIRNYAKIKRVDRQYRRDLIPDEPDHERADGRYSVLRLERAKELRVPLYSRWSRDDRFLTTDWNHLINAKEWNDLYLGSPLERRFYEGLRRAGLFAEREFWTQCSDLGRPRSFRLDFAVFCREGRLDIEVDGDSYHLRPERVVADNERDNILASNRWSVLRFNTGVVRHNLREALERIGMAVANYGGVALPKYN
jgi:very-short-patch-repair endonuclease